MGTTIWVAVEEVGNLLMLLVTKEDLHSVGGEYTKVSYLVQDVLVLRMSFSFFDLSIEDEFSRFS